MRDTVAGDSRCAGPAFTRSLMRNHSGGHHSLVSSARLSQEIRTGQVYLLPDVWFMVLQDSFCPYVA